MFIVPAVCFLTPLGLVYLYTNIHSFTILKSIFDEANFNFIFHCYGQYYIFLQ